MCFYVSILVRKFRNFLVYIPGDSWNSWNFRRFMNFMNSGNSRIYWNFRKFMYSLNSRNYCNIYTVFPYWNNRPPKVVAILSITLEDIRFKSKVQSFQLTMTETISIFKKRIFSESNWKIATRNYSTRAPGGIQGNTVYMLQ